MLLITVYFFNYELLFYFKPYMDKNLLKQQVPLIYYVIYSGTVVKLHYDQS
jgi:hypothetical protein